MPYNVYLREVGNSGLTDQLRQNVQTRLLGWFNQIVQNTSYGSANVLWVSSAPSIQLHELLIYFCQSQINSVIRARLVPGASGNEDGLTMFAHGVTASEVYVYGANGSSPMDGIAEVSFHECMHNKLHLGNNLHSRPGLAASAVGSSTPIHPHNITDMRAALPHAHRQWLGGFQGDALEGL